MPPFGFCMFHVFLPDFFLRATVTGSLHLNLWVREKGIWIGKSTLEPNPFKSLKFVAYNVINPPSNLHQGMTAIL